MAYKEEEVKAGIVYREIVREGSVAGPVVEGVRHDRSGWGWPIGQFKGDPKFVCDAKATT